MLLVDPLIAAQSLDISCGIGREAASAMDAILVPLNLIYTRAVAALDVASLLTSTYIDQFTLTGRGYDGQYGLRLCNGFIDPTSIIVRDTLTQTPVDPTRYGINAKYGVVYIDSRLQGRYEVEHTGGFTPVETMTAEGTLIPLNRQILAVPEWLQSVAILALNEWYRSAPRTITTVKDGMSFAAINSQANRALQNAIWNQYLRPRAEMLFATNSTLVH
jgi:hypothetical protein